MEKFSNWRDKGTGISPFMPVATPLYSSKSLVSKSGLILLKLVIFLIKLPLVVVTFTFYYVTGLQALARFIVLVLFGFNRLETLVDGVKRSHTDKIAANLPRRNDVVVVNHSSPLDGFIYATLCSGVSWSKIAIVIPDPSGNLSRYSVWSLFSHTFNPSIAGTPVKLSELKDRVVFLLLEGTPSNNNALLPFQPLQSTDFSGFYIKSVAIKYQPQYLSLPIPHISKWTYIFEALTHISIKNNFIKAKIYAHDAWNLASIKNSFEVNSLNVLGPQLNLALKKQFERAYFESKHKKD